MVNTPIICLVVTEKVEYLRRLSLFVPDNFCLSYAFHLLFNQLNQKNKIMLAKLKAP